jgi:hypothetical protein
MVTQAKTLTRVSNVAEPTTGSIQNMAARIRNQWSRDEKQDRRHQALLFQQELLRACGLVPSDGLPDVITVTT